MRLVIDTNVLLAIIPTKSSYNNIYQSLLENELEIAVSTEILLEYEEQLKIRYSSTLSVDVEIDKFLKNRNIRFYQPEFRWNLIPFDPDDNKFVDCAIAGNADYIITNDAHFNALKNIPFPRVNTLTLQQFIQLIQAK